jgi:hypothetical protein
MDKNLEYFSVAVIGSLIFQPPLIKKQMKLELQNYAVVIPIESSFIRVKHNKINNLQRCDIAQMTECTQSSSAFVPA